MDKSIYIYKYICGHKRFVLKNAYMYVQTCVPSCFQRYTEIECGSRESIFVAAVLPNMEINRLLVEFPEAVRAVGTAGKNSTIPYTI